MMEPSTTGKGNKRIWRLEPWPTAIVLFFLVIFMVNAFFVRVSMVSWTGVVTEGSYNKGLVYNQVIKAQNAQDALGWRVTLDESGLRAGEAGRLTLSLWDGTGQPLRNARIQGILFRPVAQGMDQTFTMSEEQPGLYGTRLPVPSPGQWDVKLQIQANDEEFRYVRRIQLPPQIQGG
ncbi:MAG: FixH family protein [Magnetococcales bacterium]|nr:FixH family protein [Magnetococcales bacterium]